MSETQLLTLMMSAIRVVLMTAAPPLLVGLTVGLLVSIFQTVTSIQDATLTFVPKIIAIFFAIMLFGPFMMSNLLTFMRELYLNMHLYIR